MISVSRTTLVKSLFHVVILFATLLFNVGAPVPATAASGPAATTTLTCTTDPVVTTNADSGSGSLRQALIDACSGSIITFDMSQVVSPIILTSGVLGSTQDVTISGPGASQLTITANDTSDIFQATAASPIVVSISGLTLSHGKSGRGG
ncbi:MAG: hypothetical protein QOF70_5484, partial [Acetobacteraceae bacterium]|nr:hypothetical protein [Acetobacteraceae bacterium]